MGRKTGFFAFLPVLAIAALLGACFSPWEGGDGEPNLIISLGGGSRFAFPPEDDEDLALMTAVLVLTRVGAAVGTRYEFPGNRVFSIWLEPGTYTLSLSLYYTDGNVLLAETRGDDPDNTFTVTANRVTTRNVTLHYGITSEFFVSTESEWADAVAAINDAGPGISVVQKFYKINITGDFPLRGTTVSTFAPVYIDVTLTGDGKTITLTSPGHLLSIGANQTVTMEGITLQGLKSGTNGATQDNNAPLVYIGSGGTFNMESGAISGNTNNGNGNPNESGSGGGVFVDGGGKFTMSGYANVSENSAIGSGGGVFVSVTTGGGHGEFTMSGSATVSGNKADHGGGVMVFGTFTMTGGEISGNEAIGESTSYGNGGGVYVGTDGSISGTFNMKGGTISGNKADHGGGVYVYNGCKFLISGGIVYGSNESDLSNKASPGDESAALYSSGTAQYGTFSGTNGAWVSNGSFATTDYTIEVENGVPIFTVSDPDQWDFARTTINAAEDGTAQAPKAYTINIGGDFGLDGVTSSTFTPACIDIALNGYGKIISLNSGSQGSLLRIGENQDVTMNNLTFEGLGPSANNDASLVYISGIGAEFTMTNSTVSGNKALCNGGGVYVGEDGKFTMSGGKISGNTANGTFSDEDDDGFLENDDGYGYGGGVCVNGGTFTMNNGGEISDNSTNRTSSVYVGSGTFIMENGKISGTCSGVYLEGGTFIMENGEISGNTGRGVSLGGGTFIMEDGEISRNTGGGVSVYFNSTFTMNGGEISGNTSGSSGNGVDVYGNGAFFTMNGGVISGNLASGKGQVYVGEDGAFFTMNGGVISGNTSNNGVGVEVRAHGAFRMVTGTVYGSNESNPNLRNSMALDGYWGNIFNIPMVGNQGGYNSRAETIRVENGASQCFVSTDGEWADVVSEITKYGGGAYAINITRDFYLEGVNSATFDTYCSITINGNNHTITLKSDSTGSLLRIGGEQYVTMNDLNLNGHDNNDTSLVYVEGWSDFTMNGGTISGNTNDNGRGGGVFVESESTFIMNGGEISGNRANDGGGVYLGNAPSSIFRIVTGTIYGADEGNKSNTVTGASNSAALYKSSDARVQAEYGTFSGWNWASAGTLDTTNNTIRVVNGVLQQ